LWLIARELDPEDHLKESLDKCDGKTPQFELRRNCTELMVISLLACKLLSIFAAEKLVQAGCSFSCVRLMSL